ncbi:hypothetical protein SANTM175S_08458 [Streptomyces antimycoticus]
MPSRASEVPESAGGPGLLRFWAAALLGFWATEPGRPVSLPAPCAAALPPPTPPRSAPGPGRHPPRGHRGSGPRGSDRRTDGPRGCRPGAGAVAFPARTCPGPSSSGCGSGSRRAGRSRSRVRSGAPVSSCPLSRISPLTAVVRGSCRPSTVRLVTDLPEPDSPTMPSVRPRSRSKERPSTALTTPSSVEKRTYRSRTDRKAPSPGPAGGVRAVVGLGECGHLGSSGSVRRGARAGR